MRNATSMRLRYTCHAYWTRRWNLPMLSAAPSYSMLSHLHTPLTTGATTELISASRSLWHLACGGCPSSMSPWSAAVSSRATIPALCAPSWATTLTTMTNQTRRTTLRSPKRYYDGFHSGFHSSTPRPSNQPGFGTAVVRSTNGSRAFRILPTESPLPTKSPLPGGVHSDRPRRHPLDHHSLHSRANCRIPDATYRTELPLRRNSDLHLHPDHPDLLLRLKEPENFVPVC